MTAPAITITPEASLRTAARLMVAGKIKQLPVIDPFTGRIVGTLHQADVLRVFTRPADQLLADAAAAIKAQTGLDHVDLTLSADEGIVTIRGQVDRPSKIGRIAAIVREVDGVVDVLTDLTAPPDEGHDPVVPPT